MTATQFMPYFDIHLRKKLTILSRLVWSYDSSGVQAKKYYGSMYEPILFN
jgi:site-specific DNA-methyltransferase (adenine-specific)